MTTDDDDLERRLHSAFTRPRPSDGMDADEMLSRVHRGATVRRVRRVVSGTAVAALALAGGGFAIGASGYLDDTREPVASDPTTGPPTLDTFSSIPPSAGSPSSRYKVSVGTPPPLSGGTVRVAPHGPIAAADVHPVSLTATGTDHQWVLARTPGGGCGRAACATVFTTPDHGGRWTDVGQLPAPPATSDDPGPTSVSQLRFTRRTDGSETYDGWAYGGGLLSTHDSGRTWSAGSGPPGRVTQLEAWGDVVYAGVSNPGPGDDTATLYRSSTASDDWQPVPVGPGLTSVRALAAAKDILGLVDSGGLHPVLYLSTDGLDWQRQAACPVGFDPQALSTATDTVTDVSSLWVTCSDPTSSVVRYTDTTDPGSWHPVQGRSFGAAGIVAARTPTTALVADASLGGIVEVSATAPTRQVLAGDVGAPVFLGFTNDTHGYLLESDGTMIATTDGGATWSSYAVSDTAP